MDKKTEIKQNEEEKNILLISEVNEQRWPPFTCTIETQHQRAGCFHVVPQWMRTASCSPVRDRSGKRQWLLGRNYSCQPANLQEPKLGLFPSCHWATPPRILSVVRSSIYGEKARARAVPRLAYRRVAQLLPAHATFLLRRRTPTPPPRRRRVARNRHQVLQLLCHDA